MKVAAPLILLAALGGVAYPAAAQQAPMTARDLATLPRLGDAAVSPDGRWVVYAVTETAADTFAKNSTLFLRPLGREGAPVALPFAGKAAAPAFGADGYLYVLFTPTPAADGAAGTSKAASATAQLWRGRIGLDGTLDELSQVSNVEGTIGGFLLSPDGRRVALWGQMPRACATFGCNKDKAYAPGPGSGLHFRTEDGTVQQWASYRTPGEYGRVFVFDIDAAGRAVGGVAADGGAALQSPLPPPTGGKHDLAWAPDGRALYFAARPATVGDETAGSDIYASDLAGGEPRNLTVGNPAPDALPAVSPDGRWLAYLARTNAGNGGETWRLKLRDIAAGTEREQRLTLDRTLASLVWTADSRWLLATANDTLDTPLFRIDPLSGQHERLDLIAGNEGRIAAVVPLAGNALLFTRDSVGSPAELYVSDDGKQARPLTDVAIHLVGRTASVITRRFSFAGADGATVWGQIHRPENAAGPLPAILYVHGGPHSTFGDAWSYRWNPRVVASQGYAVVSIDFHGSDGYGEAFAGSIRGDWGTKPLIDLQRGFAAAAALDPQIETGNACAMGASYGGYMMNWIAGNWPDRFKCLVNHAGVFDLQSMFYTTDIPAFSRWEAGGKDPWDDPSAYDSRNPVNHVGKWRTPTLVTAGERDFRVPFSQSLAAYNALLARGIPGELLVFPEEGHWVLDAKNSVQWHNAVFAWLGRWLKPAK